MTAFRDSHYYLKIVDSSKIASLATQKCFFGEPNPANENVFDTGVFSFVLQLLIDHYSKISSIFVELKTSVRGRIMYPVPHSARRFSFQFQQ